MCEGSENQWGTEAWGFEKVACWPLLVASFVHQLFQMPIVEKWRIENGEKVVIESLGHLVTKLFQNPML